MSEQDWLNLVQPLAVPFFLYLAWDAVAALKRHGYQTAYAQALLRAVGAAANAARDSGRTLYDPAGRAIGIKAGADYLESTIHDTSAALGITMDGHAERIDAEIGTGRNAATQSPVSALLG